MSGGVAAVEHIDAVDAFARTLFIRAKQPVYTSDGSPLDLQNVADAVRHLHLALQHLRVEAADPDSLLYTVNSVSHDPNLYVNELRPIVEDCSATLKQLEALLDRSASSDLDDAADARISAVRAKLLNETSRIDVFLDTVQLHNPENAPPLNPHDFDSSASLEGIKDKVDAVATAIFSRRRGDYSDDSLWKEFQTGLEQQGFAPEVLHKHRDVLRAYIRELQSKSTESGPPPTVRGLLESQDREASPKEMVGPSIDNEKCLASMKAERRMPHHAPVAAPPLQLPQRPSQYLERPTSSGTADSAVSDSMALISTRDLVAMDTLNTNMAAMQLGSGYDGNQKYLGFPSRAALPAPGDSIAELHGQSMTPALSSSPMHVSSLLSNNTSARSSSPGGSSRLAPDQYGNVIPLDASWTKIRRSLVSPEVLQRAGVRYEARPDFVAVLGHLSREQISEYARQSADCRAARDAREAPPLPRRPERWARDRHDSKSSRSDDGDDNESVLWDDSDVTDPEDDRTSEKDSKSYPYIVSPPEKEKYLSSATVLPKPILKNKNENHVRFDPHPRELESKSPRHIKDDRDYDRPRDRDRDRDRDRGQTRHRDHPSRRYREHRERDDASSRYRDHDRHYDDERRDRNRERDREREHRERERERHHRDLDDEGDYSRHHSHRDRRPFDRKDERYMKKKAWGETLGAVGIGGAAVSLLGVLAEATAGI